jgi:hypothetical protein
MGCLFELLFQLFLEALFWVLWVAFGTLFVAMWPGAVVGILGMATIFWLGGGQAWPWAIGFLVFAWAAIGIPYMLRPNAPPMRSFRRGEEFIRDE